MLWTTRRCGADASPFRVTVRGDAVEIARTHGGGGARPRPWSRAHDLSGLVHGALAAGARTVVVDLEGAIDVDTALLAVLIDAKRAARRSGAEFVTRGSPALRRLASICRLECVLSLG